MQRQALVWTVGATLALGGGGWEKLTLCGQTGLLHHREACGQVFFAQRSVREMHPAVFTCIVAALISFRT